MKPISKHMNSPRTHVPQSCGTGGCSRWQVCSRSTHTRAPVATFRNGPKVLATADPVVCLISAR